MMTSRTLTSRNFEIGDLVVRAQPSKTVAHPQEAGVVLKRFVKAGKVLRCLVYWSSGRTVPIKAAALKCASLNAEEKTPLLQAFQTLNNASN